MRKCTAAAIAAGLLMFGGLLATGCSSDDDGRASEESEESEESQESETQTTSDAPSTPTTPQTTSTALPDEAIDADAPDAIGPLSTDTQQSPGFLGAGQPTAQLVAVRHASQPGFQRVVLEFLGDTTPQYRVGFEDPPARQPGSGMPVDVPGSVLLKIHAEPASRVDMTGANITLTYDGPERFTLPGPGPATALVLLGDFEANMHWAVGLTRSAPFAVGVLTNPTRLVVDIATD